jgi:hypothetical protein
MRKVYVTLVRFHTHLTSRPWFVAMVIKDEVALRDAAGTPSGSTIDEVERFGTFD